MTPTSFSLSLSALPVSPPPPSSSSSSSTSCIYVRNRVYDEDLLYACRTGMTILHAPCSIFSSSICLQRRIGGASHRPVAGRAGAGDICTLPIHPATGQRRRRWGTAVPCTILSWRPHGAPAAILGASMQGGAPGELRLGTPLYRFIMYTLLCILSSSWRAHHTIIILLSFVAVAQQRASIDPRTRMQCEMRSARQYRPTALNSPCLHLLPDDPAVHAICACSLEYAGAGGERKPF